jgi:hypothetical protein
MSAEQLDLRGFHPSIRDIIGSAIDLGWTAHQAKSTSSRRIESVVLHSYDGTVTIRATPVRQVNEAKLKTLRAKVLRYAEPVKRLTVMAQIGQMEDRGNVTTEQIDAVLPTVVEAIDRGVVDLPDKTVTSTRPWQARKASSQRGGTKYESTAVLERIWSDGSMDYVCAFEGCGWANNRARSVATHFGAAHTAKGESAPTTQEPSYPAADYFEPLTHRPYKPQERLVQALMAYLMEQGDMGGLRETAEAALAWMHERPDLPDVEPTERMALSAEELLEKVRALVGAPLAVRLTEADTRIAELIGRSAELEAQVLARDAAIEHLREERRTLAELLSTEES